MLVFETQFVILTLQNVVLLAVLRRSQIDFTGQSFKFVGKFHKSGRNGVCRDFKLAARFVYYIECFIRQKSVRYVTHRKLNGGIDSFVGYDYSVMFFVFRFYPFTILTANSGVGSSTVIGWKRRSNAGSFRYTDDTLLLW